jgi:hypothetical protein
MKAFLAAAVTLVLAAPALAQQRPAPGLWEYSMTMKGDARMEAAMAQRRAQMERMTPEQRKAMEAMMAQRGVAMGADGPGQGMSVKVCLTPEQVQRDEMPTGNERNCKITSKERSGNSLRFKFECSGERQAKGEGEYVFSGDKAYKGHTVIDTMLRGQPQRMEMDHQGKWLGADCGDIQPRR